MSGGNGVERLDFSLPSLADALARGRAQTRMVADAFGALRPCRDGAPHLRRHAGKHLVWYATLFLLQALYIVFISGQGFDWRFSARRRRSARNTWNVPAALSARGGVPVHPQDHGQAALLPAPLSHLRLAGGVFVGLALSNFVRGPYTNPVITAGGNLISSGRLSTRWSLAFLRGCAAAVPPVGSWSPGGCSR